MISKWKHALFSNSAAAVLALLVLSVQPDAALTSPDVEVTGNKALSEGAIQRLMPGVQWDGAGDAQAVRGLQEAYIRKGYLFASIRLERVAVDSTIRVLIDEGVQARVGRVRIVGAEHFDGDRIRDVLACEAGATFEPATVDRGVQELLVMYDEAGYPFAQVWMDSLRVDPAASLVDLSVYVVEGGSKHLNRVRVEGLEKTKEDVAIKLSGLRTGEPYAGESMRNAYLRLSSSGVFEDVHFPTVQISPEGQGVEAVIRVVESKQSNSFMAALGYAEREGRSDHVLSGVVRLDLLNIGGGLRDLNIFWRNDGAGRIQTRLGFRQKFFLGRRMSLGVTLQQVGQDTVYTWQSLGVETGIPVGRIGSGVVGLDFAVHGDRNTFAESDVTNTMRYRLTGGYSYVLGKRHRGFHLDLANQFTHASKRLRYRDTATSSRLSQLIVGFQLRAALEIARRVHIANQSAYEHLISDEAVVPISEQFYLGGAATVRGYRENQFHSPQIAYSRTELLVGKSRAENGYLFVDVGYFDQRVLGLGGELRRDAQLIAGYGFGLRTQSKAGNVDISFAVGEEFSLQQTKIHLILNRSF